MSYKLQLEKFEGPLDLLLYLIKKDDIDICDIPIAQITDQYLEYIEMMKMLDLDVVGDFLVMAATLLQIKSRMLLPPDPLAAQEPVDPRAQLVQRLQEYEQFKLIADQLKDKESGRQDLFSRVVDEAALREIKEDSKEVFVEATIFDLINALTCALVKTENKKVYELRSEEYTVDGKIHSLIHLLVERAEVSLLELFSNSSGKSEMVVIFVAILELVRQKEVIAFQRRQFDDIIIRRNILNEQPQASM